MRLDIKALTPYIGIETDSTTAFEWRAITDDPQFLVENSALLAGQWVVLKVELVFSGQLNTPFAIYIDEGAGFSEDASFKLYPDKHGQIQFAWRTPQSLQMIRIDPVGQPGCFSLPHFSLKSANPAYLALLTSLRIVLAYREQTFRTLSDIPHLIQSGDWRGVAKRLIQTHNDLALNPFAAPNKNMPLSELPHNRKQYPERMNVLQEYIMEGFQRANSKVGVGGEYVPRSDYTLDGVDLKIKAIAFYLPQFHPIPENDLWWGKGFTDWTNVSKAQPQFLGHYQPHLPGELGFYDLRLPQVMRQQISLARQYGIHGFCFHHYWFGGKRLLELPVNNFLRDSTLDINFCLCWANENWSRRWDGSESDLLIAQAHSPEDDIAFFDSLIPAFSDPRYIRIDGKPLLIVYLASLLPNAAETAQRWRDRAIESGFPGIYLVAARSFHVTSPKPFEFDAAVEFPPHQVAVEEIAYQCEIVNPDYQGKIYSYRGLAECYAKISSNEFVNFKTVMPAWDNEARKPGRGNIYHGSNPELYAKWLSDAARTTMQNRTEERLIFINAWNEWAEGAHLEPDRRYGYAYLQATADVLRNLG